jgi:hypothetical protein
MTHNSVVPLQRRDATLRYGALVLDTAYSAGRVHSIAGALYEDLPSLVRFATGILAAVPGEAYYHSFHSARGLDLVVSRDVDGARWWTSTGLVDVTDWNAEDDRILAQDAALRTAAGTIETQGLPQSFDAIARATARAFARPELLAFAARCVDVKKFSLAGKIIDDRLVVDRNDPTALFLDAKITMSLVSTRQWPVERLRDAEAKLAIVIGAQPSNLAARLMRADIPRYAGDPAGSVPRFEELLRDFPTCDAAHYNLGVILLGTQPDRALGHFAAGRAIAPRDPDYVLGEARALVALRRVGEARERLAQAERMAPSHPMIPKVRSQLGG